MESWMRNRTVSYGRTRELISPIPVGLSLAFLCTVDGRNLYSCNWGMVASPSTVGARQWNHRQALHLSRYTVNVSRDESSN